MGRPRQMQFEEAVPPEVRAEDMRRRHDAFWGPLSEAQRNAARVASGFFRFMQDLNNHLFAKTRAESAETSDMYWSLALECASAAYAQFRRFGGMLGCRDDAEAAERLDRLVDYGHKTEWTLEPAWWRMDPSKGTAYFIGQLGTMSARRDEWIREKERLAEEQRRVRRERKLAKLAAAKEGGAA